MKNRHLVLPRGSRLVFYSAMLFMLAFVFVLSACSVPAQTPSISPSISVSPAESPVSYEEAPSASPVASDYNVAETTATPIPINPMRLFYLSFISDTEENRTAFNHALSKGGIDTLNALMELCDMDAYLSKAPLSIGSLLLDTSSYSGELSVPEGSGSLNPTSGEFTFSYANGNVLSGMLEQSRMGCYALDAGGGFLYMVRMEKAVGGWLVCVDTADKRILAQWASTNRFTSFSNTHEPYLSKANKNEAASWGEALPAVSFAVENWYDFSWDTLCEGAASVFSVTGETLIISSAP